MKSLIILAFVALVPITALAQEAETPPCPPVVDIPSESTIAGLRACGEDALADASERRLRMLRGLAAADAGPPADAAVPPPAAEPPVVAPVPPPVAEPPPVSDAERAALAARVAALEAELGRLREERAAPPEPVAPEPPRETVVAPVPDPIPTIGEESARMAGGSPLVTVLPGFLHRRPVPWSPRRGLRLWNGLNCDGDFSFAIEVRVDGRVVVPTEMGAAWPPIPVMDSTGRRSTAYLVPQGRDRRSGGYVYIPVGGGDHNIQVTVYDAPLGMTPMRLGGGSFRFNPSTAGDLHQLRWYEVSGSDSGFCGAR